MRKTPQILLQDVRDAAECRTAVLAGASVQVNREDLIGELLKSLYGTRKAAHKWENKWQRVVIEGDFVIGTWS